MHVGTQDDVLPRPPEMQIVCGLQVGHLGGLICILPAATNETQLTWVQSQSMHAYRRSVGLSDNQTIRLSDDHSIELAGSPPPASQIELEFRNS